MRHRNPQIESEVFRAFRLTRSQVEKMPDGELLGALNRVIVEMAVRDQSVVIIEQLQTQIDLLVAMPERKKVPRKKKRAWRYWDYGVPINYSWGEVDEGRREPSADKTPTVDTAIRTGQVIADVEADPDDAPPGVPVDHTWERQKIQDAIEEAAEAEAEHKREAAQFEADLVARAAEGWRE